MSDPDGKQLTEIGDSSQGHQTGSDSQSGSLQLQQQLAQSISASSVTHLSPLQKANAASEKIYEKEIAKAAHTLAQQQRRIIAEDPEWNLAPVDKLSDMCVRVIVANFESKYQ